MSEPISGGAYTVERAAALSGVPQRTVHYWAQNKHLLPSVADAPRLYSFADLLALRVLYWLRRPKHALDHEIPATSMPKIQRAFQQIRHLGLDWVEDGQSTLGVTLDGSVAINAPGLPPQRAPGQLFRSDVIDVLAPFEGLEGTGGPDLRRPRPLLRILPRKISGAPHIEGSRLPTESIHALAKRGYSVGEIVSIYPFASTEAVSNSIDLERQLHGDVDLKAAA